MSEKVTDHYKSIWVNCLAQLKEEIDNQGFNTWVRPLKVAVDANSKKITLLAPNRFIVNWVQEHYYNRITELIMQFSEEGVAPAVVLQVKGTDIKNHAAKGYRQRCCCYCADKST